MARGGVESLLPLLSHLLGAQHAFSGAYIDSNIKSMRNCESSERSRWEGEKEEKVMKEEGVKKGEAEEEM